jgi:hypothetical protein
MDLAQLNDKLIGWCILYGAGMLFIGGRIYVRLHLYGSLATDDWFIVAAAVAYTGCMITEIFVFLAFRATDITAYIAVCPRISKRTGRQADGARVGLICS